MQKAIFLFLLLFVAVESAFAAAWTGANNEPNDMKNIDGKAFYVITNANELAWFANQVNGGRTSINAVLANDIVFGSSTTVTSTVNWTPIGKDSTAIFNGTFDGAGHTIYGLYSKQTAAGQYEPAFSGIFGITGKNAVVKNLNTRMNFVAGRKVPVYVGGIVAFNWGKIENCSNNSAMLDTVVASSYAPRFAYIGGIAGWNAGEISNSYNESSIKTYELGVSSALIYAGGIAGWNAGKLVECDNKALIFQDKLPENSGTFFAAGIAANNAGTIVSCYNSGAVDVRNNKKSSYAGGIAGYNTGTLSKNYNVAKISIPYAVTSNYVGGIVGKNESNVENCYNNGNVENGGAGGTGSIVGQSTGNIKSCYSSVTLQYWINNTEFSCTSTDMQKDQFAWILNTANGTATNSKIWSRTTGYPIFATSTNKPIVRVVFNDNGATSNRYGTSKGTVSFQSNSTPATGYIFDGWYNGTTKVSASTVFTADATVSAKYLNTATLSYTIKFYDDDQKTLLSTQSVGYGKTPVYSGATPTKAATAQYSYTFSKWDRTLAAAYQDTSYYAVYTSTVNSYSIVFKDYDSTKLQSSAVNYGVTPTCSKTPTRASTAEWKYTFKGWTPTVTSVTKAATYTAVYDSSKVQYAITFNNYDGTKLSTVNVNYGAIPSYSGIPTRTGSAEWAYSFKEWTPSLEAVTKAATYTAVYDSVTAEYDVTFKDYDGKILQTTKLEYGTMPAAPTAPSRTATAEWSFTFAGWDKELATVSDSEEYKAIYDSTKNSYEVTFVDFDNSEIQKTVLEYGETPTCTKIPTRESSAEWNYEFKGWNPAIASVTGKTTYKAVYDSSKVKYVVSLMSEGSAVQTENVAYGETFTVPRGVAKDGYTFVGWYVGEDLLGNVGDVIIVAQNIVAEAKYSINSYVVKFLDFDGTILKKDSYEYGNIPVYGSAVSREATAEWNYEFIGWTPAIGKVIKATNYTAMYDSTKVKYEVVFMNGNAEIDAQEVEYGSAAEKPADPKKAGFTFVGWNKDFSNVTENLVVEALFEENIVSSSSENHGNSSSSLLPTSSSSMTNAIFVAAQAPKIRLSVVGRSIQIAGIHFGTAYAILDIQGRILVSGRAASSNFAVKMPCAGSYLVRVGSLIQRVNLK